MPLRRYNQRVFHRRLYAAQLETIILLKRNDDQGEGTVTPYCLYQVRRGNVDKTGQPIQRDMSTDVQTQWLIPSVELLRVGVRYINVLDRIVDKFAMWWQPETDQNITMAIFDNYWVVDCVRIDPPANSPLAGIYPQTNGPAIGFPGINDG